MKQYLRVPAEKIFNAQVSFHNDENDLAQVISFHQPKVKRGAECINIPFRKTMKGSMYLTFEPGEDNYILQGFRVYRKTNKKKSTPIHETRYSRVSVSKSRVTFTMSFPLCDDPERLTARMQNFANIIIDESDEIAAMLNQEGAIKIQEAWNSINQSNSQNNEEA